MSTHNGHQLFFFAHYGLNWDFCRHSTSKSNVVSHHGKSQQFVQLHGNHKLNFFKHYIWSLLLCKPTDSNDDPSSGPLSFDSRLAVQTSWAEVKRTGARILCSSNWLKLAIKAWQSRDRRQRQNATILIQFLKNVDCDVNVETVWCTSEHKTKLSIHIRINQ